MNHKNKEIMQNTIISVFKIKLIKSISYLMIVPLD